IYLADERDPVRGRRKRSVVRRGNLPAAAVEVHGPDQLPLPPDPRRSHDERARRDGADIRWQLRAGDHRFHAADEADHVAADAEPAQAEPRDAGATAEDAGTAEEVQG